MTLIERLQQASGPDRALDVDIHAMVSTDRRHPYLLGTFITPEGRTYECPRYTGSIDQAMALALVNEVRKIGEGE